MPKMKQPKQQVKAVQPNQIDRLNAISRFLLGAACYVGWEVDGFVLAALQQPLSSASSARLIQEVRKAHNIAFHRVFASGSTGNEFAYQFIKAHYEITPQHVAAIKPLSDDEVRVAAFEQGEAQQMDPVRQAVRALLLSPELKYKRFGLVYLQVVPEVTESLRLDFADLPSTEQQPMAAADSELQRFQRLAARVVSESPVSDEDRAGLESGDLGRIKVALARLGVIRTAPRRHRPSTQPARVAFPVFIRDDPAAAAAMAAEAGELMDWAEANYDSLLPSQQVRSGGLMEEINERHDDPSCKLAHIQSLVAQLRNIKKDHEKRLARLSASPEPIQRPQSRLDSVLEEKGGYTPWIVPQLERGDKPLRQKGLPLVRLGPVRPIQPASGAREARSPDSNGYGKDYDLSSVSGVNIARDAQGTGLSGIGRPNFQAGASDAKVVVKMTTGSRTKRKTQK